MIMLRSSTRSEILLRRRGYEGRTNHGCARIPNPENRRGARPNQNAKDTSARTAKKTSASRKTKYKPKTRGLLASRYTPEVPVKSFLTFLFKVNISIIKTSLSGANTRQKSE